MADATTIFNLLRAGITRVTEPCRIPGCAHFSMGFVCKTCSRFVCNRHGFVTMPSPSAAPTVKCASCIIDACSDLLDEPAAAPNGSARAEREQPRAAASDEDVLEADWEPVR